MKRKEGCKLTASDTNDIGFLIKNIHESTKRAGNNAMSELGLTLAQIRVLGYIYSRGNKKTAQKDIETFLSVSHPTVVGLLKRLEKKGLIRFEADSDDRRVKNIRLTEKEHALRDEMNSRHRKLGAVLTNGMSEQDKQELNRLLTIVQGNICSLCNIEKKCRNG